MTKNLYSKQEQPDWVVIYVTHDIRDAHIIAGRLEHEGIPHMMHTQPGASAIGLTLGRMGEIKILVKPEDYDEAFDILFPEESPGLEDDSDIIIRGLDDDDE